MPTTKKQLTVREKIAGKNPQKKATIKSAAIVSAMAVGKYVNAQYGVALEVEGIEQIEGGIQVFARAFKDGKQLGFGEDGSIDIERFKIFNPPIIVDDPNGDIVYNLTIERTGEPIVYRMREDVVAATVESVAHTALVTGKQGTKITPGKVGNTTSTFYPNSGTGAAPVDGRAYRSVDASFSSIRTGAGDGGDATSNFGSAILGASATTNQYNQLRRFICGFDTSAIPDTDVISSATISFYGDTAESANALSQSAVVDRRVPASTTDITSTDYLYTGWDSVEQATTRITLATWDSATGYKDFTLNATGIGNISKTGLSWFGLRLSGDFDNSAPTWSSGVTAVAHCWQADESGNTHAPKLVVVHAAPPSVTETNLNRKPMRGVGRGIGRP